MIHENQTAGCLGFLNARKIKGIHSAPIFKFMSFMEPLHLDTISIEPLPGKNQQEISILRLDKIHPDISGNKWFKLKYYFDEAINRNTQTIATFGGAWSNHILATAAACQLKNLKSTGIIRGEQPKAFSYTLSRATDYGMKLIFISRDDYRQKIVPSKFADIVQDSFVINEGGYGETGAAGAATIADYYKKEDYTHICCAVGTGTMMAGLIKAATTKQTIVGISVLKNNSDLQKETEALLTEDEKKKKFLFIHNYHFGGYGKYTAELIDFMNGFYRNTSVPTDFVYTAKLAYGVYDLVTSNFFPPDSRLLIIHSGGLQGNRSLKNGMLIF